MEKNYYEILEVDKNASNEIIEKAYKTLVKKYHPDLQNENQKDIDIYEEKIKQINEAYSVLSNPDKKNQYDTKLKNNKNNYENLYSENIKLKKELNYLKNQVIVLKNTLRNNQTIGINNLKNSNQYYNNQQSQNTYSNNWKASSKYYNNQATNKYQDQFNSQQNNDTKKEFYYTNKNQSQFINNIKNIVAFFITFLILFTLWHIPFIKKFIISLITPK